MQTILQTRAYIQVHKQLIQINNKIQTTQSKIGRIPKQTRCWQDHALFEGFYLVQLLLVTGNPQLSLARSFITPVSAFVITRPPSLWCVYVSPHLHLLLRTQVIGSVPAQSSMTLSKLGYMYKEDISK